MKVAVTATGPTLDSQVDTRFGRAKYFLLIDSQTNQYETADNDQNLEAAQGAGIQAARNVADLAAEAVITGNVGPKAFKVLQAAGIKVFRCAEGITVRASIDRLKAGKLQELGQANVEGHWV